MEELRFNCPKKLSQKYWAICRDREETMGSALRNLMLREIAITDPEFRKRLAKMYDYLDDTEDD